MPYCHKCVCVYVCVQIVQNLNISQFLKPKSTFGPQYLAWPFCSLGLCDYQVSTLPFTYIPSPLIVSKHTCVLRGQVKRHTTVWLIHSYHSINAILYSIIPTNSTSVWTVMYQSCSAHVLSHLRGKNQCYFSFWFFMGNCADTIVYIKTSLNNWKIK